MPLQRLLIAKEFLPDNIAIKHSNGRRKAHSPSGYSADRQEVGYRPPPVSLMSSAPKLTDPV
jgi:hypothetical protein